MALQVSKLHTLILDLDKQDNLDKLDHLLVLLLVVEEVTENLKDFLIQVEVLVQALHLVKLVLVV